VHHQVLEEGILVDIVRARDQDLEQFEAHKTGVLGHIAQQDAIAVLHQQFQPLVHLLVAKDLVKDVASWIRVGLFEDSIEQGAQRLQAVAQALGMIFWGNQRT